MKAHSSHNWETLSWGMEEDPEVSLLRLFVPIQKRIIKIDGVRKGR